MSRPRRSSEFACRPAMTLMELLMVLIVVGILVAIAIPSYHKTVERGYWREAQDLLITVYSGERVYFFSNDEYKGGLAACNGDPTCMADWRKIFMDDPNLNSIPVKYDVAASAPPGPTFKAEAVRTDGSNRRMWIDEQRQWCGGPDINSCTQWPMP